MLLHAYGEDRKTGCGRPHHMTVYQFQEAEITRFGTQLPESHKRVFASWYATTNISMSAQTLEEPQLKKRKMTPVDDEKAGLAPVSNLLIKRHSEKAKIPTKGSPLAAGYDLYR